MVKRTDIKILSIKRQRRVIHGEGRYVNVIKYEYEGRKKVHEGIYVHNENIEQRIDRMKNVVWDKEKDFATDKSLHQKKQQIAKTSPPTQKKRGYYFSSIKMSVIIRHKHQTPYHFPKKNRTNQVIRARNLTEKELLRNVLGEEYDTFKWWYDNAKENKNIYIYGGWTYKRTFSRTGSFNGDSIYIDYIQRIFQGNKGLRTINKFDRYRTRDTTKKIRI